jgi:hypothetical protein
MLVIWFVLGFCQFAWLELAPKARKFFCSPGPLVVISASLDFFPSWDVEWQESTFRCQVKLQDFTEVFEIGKSKGM